MFHFELHAANMLRDNTLYGELGFEWLPLVALLIPVCLDGGPALMGVAKVTGKAPVTLPHPAPLRWGCRSLSGGDPHHAQPERTIAHFALSAA
eukprot:m.294685 g.294685  ORF g.294685 m.294685 type:complete len:93 (-) comp48585_c0_seq1:1208-1486(-)